MAFLVVQKITIPAGKTLSAWTANDESLWMQNIADRKILSVGLPQNSESIRYIVTLWATESAYNSWRTARTAEITASETHNTTHGIIVNVETFTVA
jgi:hypothetical protein